MTNNAETDARMKSLKKEVLTLVLVGLFLAFIGTCMNAAIGPREVSVSSSAATVEVTPAPKIETSWSLEGTYMGGVGGSGPFHRIRVNMQNDLVDCRSNSPLNCCLASVAVDGVEDGAMGRELCTSLLAVSPGPGPVDELRLEWFLRKTVDNFYEHHFGDVPSYSHSSTRHVERVR